MWITVLEVGGEGGSMRLNGRQLKNGQWIFTRVTNEGTLKDFLSEEDQHLLSLAIKEESKVVVGWDQGIRLMNSAWPMLFPLKVHPAFGEAVWAALLQVSKKGLRSFHLRDWAVMCFPDSEEAAKRYREAKE